MSTTDALLSVARQVGTAACTAAWVAVNGWGPSWGLDCSCTSATAAPRFAANLAQPASCRPPHSHSPQVVPDNIAGAAVQMNVLGLITFSLMLGLALASLGERAAAPASRWSDRGERVLRTQQLCSWRPLRAGSRQPARCPLQSRSPLIPALLSSHPTPSHPRRPLCRRCDKSGGRAERGGATDGHLGPVAVPPWHRVPHCRLHPQSLRPAGWVGGWVGGSGSGDAPHGRDGLAVLWCERCTACTDTACCSTPVPTPTPPLPPLFACACRHPGRPGPVGGHRAGRAGHICGPPPAGAAVGEYGAPPAGHRPRLCLLPPHGLWLQQLGGGAAAGDAGRLGAGQGVRGGARGGVCVCGGGGGGGGGFAFPRWHAGCSGVV